jgi:D-alanine transaminase
MSRIVYVNGRYLPYDYAQIPVEDRGYQLADGVYEVVAVMNGKMADLYPHLDRLQRSLAAIDIEFDLSHQSFEIIMRELLRRNRITNGVFYLQITRGMSARQFHYPNPPIQPHLVIIARHFDYQKFIASKVNGVKVITHPDIRWPRPYIKSVSLLPNVLMKQTAYLAGAHEAVLINSQGYVTEGAASNLWIINEKNELQTHPTDSSILNGITRAKLIEIADKLGITFVEKPYKLPELLSAKEAFLSGATTWAVGVIQVNDHIINDGKPGPITQKLHKKYLAYVRGKEDVE